MIQKFQMNFMRKDFLVIICLVVGFLFSCNVSSENPEIIDFWALGVEGEYVQKIIPEFEKQTGIKVKVQSIPWSAAHEKLLTAYAGNSMPDVFQLGNTWIPEFVLLEALEPLDKWVDSSFAIQESAYFEGIWETNILDNILYGIPWYVDTRVVFYRKDLLDSLGYFQFPESWGVFLDLNRKLVKQKKAKYGIYLPSNEWVSIVILGLQAGSSILTQDNCFGNFSGDKFIKGFNFFMQFYREGLCPVGMTKVSNIYQAFENAFFAMIITGPWNVGEFSRRLPPKYQDKWATAPLPSPVKGKPGISLAGGSSLVMFSESQKKKQVWKFIEHMSSPDVQTDFYQLTGDLPARLISWEDSVIVNNPYIEAFYQQLQHVKSPPKIPEWEQIALKLQQYAEIAVYGKLQPEKALEKLDQEVDIILEKRRWLKNRDK